MKGWSARIAAVVVLALVSWVLIYHIEGVPPTPGITIAVAGFWVGVVWGVTWLRER
jgi:hypothetical protein